MPIVKIYVGGATRAATVGRKKQPSTQHQLRRRLTAPTANADVRPGLGFDMSGDVSKIQGPAVHGQAAVQGSIQPPECSIQQMQRELGAAPNEHQAARGRGPAIFTVETRQGGAKYAG